MMTKLREKTALILWFVIFAFIALIVVEWGADYSQTSSAGHGDTVGTVNGEKITLKVFQAALRNAARQQQGEEREDQNKLVREVWQAFVRDVVLRQEMDKLGVQVTDEEIAYYTRTQPPPAVRQIEAFQTDGQFDPDKYVQFLSDPTSLSNPTNRAFVMQVEAMLAEQLRQFKLQRLVMETVHVPPTAVRDFYQEQHEKVAVEYVFVPAAGVSEVQVEVAEADLQAYYQEHQEEHRHPEQIRAEYVLWPKAASAADSVQVAEEIQRLRQEVEAGADFAELAETVSEDQASAARGGDVGAFARGRMVAPFEEAAFALQPGQVSQPVRTRYGWHLIKVEERLQEEGEEKVKARHILLRFKPSRETEEDLRVQAEDFQAKAAAEGFRTAAEKAGVQVQDAGYLERGGMVPGLGVGTAWLVNMLFESETGEVTKVGESEDVMWVAHLVDHRPEGVKPLAEVREQVEREVGNHKRAEQAAARLAGVLEQVQGGASLEQAARQAQLEVQKAEPFTRSGSVPGIGRGNAFIGAAFALDEPGRVSPVVTVPSRGAYLVRLAARVPVDEGRFDAEREQVAAQLLQQRQEETVKNWLDGVFDRAQIEDYRHHFYTF